MTEQKFLSNLFCLQPEEGGGEGKHKLSYLRCFENQQPFCVYKLQTKHRNVRQGANADFQSAKRILIIQMPLCIEIVTLIYTVVAH
jgi:hypothetical protein